jgi:hypothetical protein
MFVYLLYFRVFKCSQHFGYKDQFLLASYGHGFYYTYMLKHGTRFSTHSVCKTLCDISAL